VSFDWEGDLCRTRQLGASWTDSTNYFLEVVALVDELGWEARLLGSGKVVGHPMCAAWRESLASGCTHRGVLVEIRMATGPCPCLRSGAGACPWNADLYSGHDRTVLLCRPVIGISRG
jgi:hypothetical protein